MPEAKVPIIPEMITVHLGPPSSNAQNVRVPFSDYIKNVASSEIYPTWSPSAIRANVLAQISFALNRIYTEYYRSRGYDFDITNSTAYDQSFVYGRDYFENVSQIVDDIFNDYLRREGNIEPLFAQYCNGTTTTCEGLSQWGSEQLAQEGFSSVDILKQYYGDDVELVVDAPVGGFEPSAPEVPLRIGSVGDDVRTLQLRLNRVSTNYPNIPKIYPEDGVFDQATEAAVREFQKTFNLSVDGIVGKSTWYELQRVWSAVKNLNEVTSEGVKYEEVALQYEGVIKEGDSGPEVGVFQYYLYFIGNFVDSVMPPPLNSVYDAATVESVKSYQRTYGLPETGELDRATWDSIYDTYAGILASLPDSAFIGNTVPYPGTPLREGEKSENVKTIQEYLNAIARVYTAIPTLTADGVFGPATRNAVEIFQEIFGIPVTGTVNLNTWYQIARQYDETTSGLYRNEEQYPGYEVGE